MENSSVVAFSQLTTSNLSTRPPTEDMNVTSARNTSTAFPEVTSVYPASVEPEVTSVYPSSTEETINQTGSMIIAQEPHHYITLANNMYIYILSTIIIVGVINNIIVLLIMRKEKMKFMSVSVYLSVLAVSDSSMLLCDITFNLVDRIFGTFLLGTSTALCRITRTVLTTSFTCSAWLIVCIVIERVVVVCFPFRAKSLCNVRVARITCAVVFLFSLAVNCFQMFVWVARDGVCFFYPQYAFFMQYVHMWLQATLFSYLPFLILVCGNSLLIYRLSVAQKQRENMTRGSDKTIDKKTEQLAHTAVAICMAYLICTTPAAIYYTIAYETANYDFSGPSFAIAQVIINILGNSNYGINLYLYILTSKRFRNEFKSLFPCVRSQSPAVQETTKEGTASSVI